MHSLQRWSLRRGHVVVLVRRLPGWLLRRCHWLLVMHKLPSRILLVVDGRLCAVYLRQLQHRDVLGRRVVELHELLGRDIPGLGGLHRMFVVRCGLLLRLDGALNLCGVPLLGWDAFFGRGECLHTMQGWLLCRRHRHVGLH